MPEITKRVRIGKILTFSIDKKSFIKLKNIFGMVTGRNIEGMSFSKYLKAREQSELNQDFSALVLEKV